MVLCGSLKDFKIAEWCNGSTSPSGGENWGSNPCSAAK